MLVSDVLRKTQRRFGDSDNTIFTTPDIIDWVNEAMLQIVRETNCQIVATVTVVANAFPYTTAADLISVARVVYGVRPLQSTTYDELDSLSIDLKLLGEPYYYYTVGTQVWLYPDPNTTDTTVVEVWYHQSATTVTLVTDTPAVPFYYHEDIVTWCVMRAKERVSDFRGQEMCLAEFNSNVGRRVEEVNRIDDFHIIRDDPWDEL